MMLPPSGFFVKRLKNAHGLAARIYENVKVQDDGIWYRMVT